MVYAEEGKRHNEKDKKERDFVKEHAYEYRLKLERFKPEKFCIEIYGKI
jgi:hypothetical protein